MSLLPCPEVLGPGRCSGTSRHDHHGLGQAERLRKFPRRLGQFPFSVLAKPRLVPAPPVTSAPASPTTSTSGNSECPSFLVPGVAR